MHLANDTAPVAMTTAPRPRILHIGDSIKHNPDLYQELESQFDIIRPDLVELERESFKQALKDNKYGNFHAILRPFWNTGGEMGQWNQELISLLPSTVKVFASAGAGYNWADVDVLAEHGRLHKPLRFKTCLYTDTGVQVFYTVMALQRAPKRSQTWRSITSSRYSGTCNGRNSLHDP